LKGNISKKRETKRGITGEGYNSRGQFLGREKRGESHGKNLNAKKKQGNAGVPKGQFGQVDEVYFFGMGGKK